MAMSVPPDFKLIPVVGPFVRKAGSFWLREDNDGGFTVGTLIAEDQSNLDGFAHGGFLLTFADFAITFTTRSITINLSADFMRAGRIGDWIEARINVRKRSRSLLFADAIITSGGDDLMRVSGIFRPVDKDD
mgnify:CR=1 FL=1